MRSFPRWLSCAFGGLIFTGLAAALQLPGAQAVQTRPAAHIKTIIIPASHPAWHVRHAHLVSMPTSYTTVKGDTLISVAARFYGSARDWPALWWVNRDRVPNPDKLATGQQLRLSAWHPPASWIVRKAAAAVPPPPPPRPAGPAPVAAAGQVATQPAGVVTTGGMSSFQQCVIAAESGGNPAAVNPSSGAGGLYQFLPSTWAALGHSGLPENASVAEQNQAFAQEYAQSGTSAWAPYDGC